MQSRLSAFVLLIVMLAVSSLRLSADEETQLGNEMSAMNRAFRQLKKQAADSAQNAASLELVSKIKKAAEASADLPPAKAGDLPEADRAAFIAKYKEEMKKLLVAIDQLEAAFKAGDNAEAEKIIAELGKMQRSGHKEFRKPKE